MRRWYCQWWESRSLPFFLNLQSILDWRFFCVILKLNRQTGKTTYNNIRELRSGWKAFWYNTTANIFKLSLKSEYSPEFINEDYLVEDIIQRAIIDEKIEYQKPKLSKDFMAIVSKSRGAVDVEEYKEMFRKIRKKRNRKSKRKKKS